MGTQKTGRGQQPPKKNVPAENRPTDYLGDEGGSVELAGRKMRRVDLRDEMAKTAQELYGKPTHPMEPPPPQMDPDAKAKVSAMMPDFLKEEHKEERERAAPSGALEDAESAKLIYERYMQARQEGDDRLADELKQLLGSVLGETAPKRKREPKPIHPTLAKLRRNLGVQRIDPASIDWAGFKWHFRPSSASIDQWAGQMNEQGVSTISAIKVSSLLVGIDDIPLYKIFGINLNATFVPDDGMKEVTIRVFEKRCDACEEILDADATECSNCGSAHDPFDMPLPLRLQCVDRVHNWFLTEFGPFEELSQLHTLMREKMKDRLGNKEELFPFLSMSPDSSMETNTMPSGDE